MAELFGTFADEIDTCWTRGRQDGTCGWPDGLDLDDLSMQIRRIRRCDEVFSLKIFFVKLADIFEMAELFETFATMR